MRTKKKESPPRDNRTCRVTLRLTESERAMFKKKADASFHGNVSKMIVHAVGLFKQDRLKSKYSQLTKFTDTYNQLASEMKKSGTNLNQLAHQLNSAMLKYSGHPPAGYINDFIGKMLKPVIEAHAGLLVQLIKFHDKIVKDTVRQK